MKEVETKILVNMQDCSDILFTFKNENIIKSKRIPANNTCYSLVYYLLSENIQKAIDVFLNPNAIRKD